MLSTFSPQHSSTVLTQAPLRLPQKDEGLMRDDLLELARHGSRRVLERGKPVYREGTSADAIYLVLEGRIKLSRANELGQERLLGLVGPGEVLGVELLAGQIFQRADAIALGRTTVAALDQDRLNLLLRRSPELAHTLLGALAERVLGLEQQLELGYAPVAVRMTKALLWLAERFGQPETEGWCRLEVGLRHEELGTLIGVTRPTTTHTLISLRQAGLIKGTRGTYWIQLRKLQEYLEDLAFAA